MLIAAAISCCLGCSSVDKNAIAGHDPEDSTSVNELQAPICDWLEGLEVPVAGLKIAVVPEFTAGADEQVRGAIAQALEVYKSVGAEIVEVGMTHLDYAIAAYYVIATAEAASNLARYDGVHYGRRTKNPADYVEVCTGGSRQGTVAKGTPGDSQRAGLLLSPEEGW